MSTSILTSSAPADVLVRVYAFTAMWVCVRLFASHVVFKRADKPINQGTKTVIVLHSAFQAVAALWLVAYDPVIAPLLRQLAARPASLELANVDSPGVSLLATVAVGEFACQMAHVGWWYEKPNDVLMVVHHSFSALIWPIAVAARRSHFFLANMLFYELSTPFMGVLHFVPKEWSTTYAVLGSLFTLNFVLARLVTIPLSAYAFYVTWGSWTAPPLPGQADWFGPGWLLVEKIFVPLPGLLNLVWGRQVVVGYVKKLQELMRKKGD